jgi:hypothetical protein
MGAVATRYLCTGYLRRGKNMATLITQWAIAIIAVTVAVLFVIFAVIFLFGVFCEAYKDISRYKVRK